MGKDDKLIDYIKSGKGLPPRKESSKYQTEKRRRHYYFPLLPSFFNQIEK